MVVVACFLPGRAKDLSAPPRICNYRGYYATHNLLIPSYIVILRTGVLHYKWKLLQDKFVHVFNSAKLINDFLYRTEIRSEVNSRDMPDALASIPTCKTFFLIGLYASSDTKFIQYWTRKKVAQRVVCEVRTEQMKKTIERSPFFVRR